MMSLYVFYKDVLFFLLRLVYFWCSIMLFRFSFFIILAHILPYCFRLLFCIRCLVVLLFALSGIIYFSVLCRFVLEFLKYFGAFLIVSVFVSTLFLLCCVRRKLLHYIIFIWFEIPTAMAVLRRRTV
jgi:hypothetical protein